MGPSEELISWVQSLTMSEKRFVKLLGKTRAGSDSQLLELFDWLCRAEQDTALPKHAKFTRNLPTLSIRLRTLILDSLRLLHKEDNSETRLRCMIDEIGMLQSKKLHPAAARQLRKAKKIAYESSRYSFVLLCLENELQTAQKLPVQEFAERLQELREEELSVLSKRERLRELQHRHDSILLLARQFPFSLQPDIVKRARELAEAPMVEQCLHEKNYLENALAVNLLGIRDLFIRDPDSAVPRYQALIRRWQQHPEWQADQPVLLLTFCKYYQNTCIFSPVDHEKVQADLAFLKGFDGLPKTESVLLQDLLYNNQFTFALNTGNFDVLQPMIAEIDQWLGEQADFLSDNQVLPFLCNFTVAEFLAGNFTSAKKFVNRILNLNNRKARIDIYEFALVLQAVLQYQTDSGLNDYLIRSGKRRFTKNKIAVDFELLILRHIERLMDADTQKDKKNIFGQLQQALEKFSKTLPDTIPLLGLNEIHMWAEAEKTGKPVKEIFLDRVQKNLQMLEQQQKVG